MRRLVFPLLALFCMAEIAAAAGTRTPGLAILARVNGSILTRVDLEQRIMAIHRYAPMLPGADSGAVDMAGLLHEMIDEELMIQEARSLGLDSSLQVRSALDAFEANQSIIRLHREAVLDAARIEEEDMLAYFRNHYSGNATDSLAVLEQMRPRIERHLRKQRERELSGAFVAGLRGRADILVNHELLGGAARSSAREGVSMCAAIVNNECIPLADYLSDREKMEHRRAAQCRGMNCQAAPVDDPGLEDKALEDLLTHVLVRQEALRRGYNRKHDFREVVARRERELLLAAFRQQIVMPLAIPEEGAIRAYYDNNPEEFMSGSQVFLARMDFGDRDRAERVLSELSQGADFEYIARVAGRSFPAGWQSDDSLPLDLRSVLAGLEPGQVTGVMPQGRRFSIYKLKARREGTLEDYARVRERIRERLIRENCQTISKLYLDGLRAQAGITVDRKLLDRLSAELWGPKGTKAEGGRP